MAIHRIQSDDAPQPIGPYSQAIRSGDLLFLSGQVALDPSTGDLLGEGDVTRETEVAIGHLRAVLEAAGGSLENVVKTTIYLKEMSDFPAVNEVYGRHFLEGREAPPPARATVAVAGLPKGAQVEIEAIAVLPA